MRTPSDSYRASEEVFDPIRTVVNLLLHAFDGLRRGIHFWNRDVIFFEKSPNVDGSPALRIKRLAGGENARTANFAGVDALSDSFGVVENRCEIKHSREAPVGEHLLELRGEFTQGETFGVEKARSEDMHMTVPETCGDH